MTDSIDEKAQALKDIEACLDEAVKYLVDLAGAKPDKHSPQNCRLRIDEARLYARHLYALPAAPMPGVKATDEQIDAAIREWMSDDDRSADGFRRRMRAAIKAAGDR